MHQVLGDWKVNNGLAVTMICLVAGIAAFGFTFMQVPAPLKHKPMIVWRQRLQYRLLIPRQEWV